MISDGKLGVLLPPGLMLAGAMAHAQVAGLKSHAELTHYEETSRWEHVVRFFTELQSRSPLMRLESFGQSHEGRALPLVILADPPVSQPREAHASGKPVVLIMANIHGGEVEGKEAVQRVAQRLVTGDLRPLLGKLIILLAPIYNADGNERISLENRPEQNGPIGGVGTRENAQGLDLNRDFVKLEAPETRALVGLFNRWDPHLTVDLHTTDGSYHGYHLTYSIPLNPTVDREILAYHRDEMMPALANAMRRRHDFRTYYYGNFSEPATGAGGPETRTWRAFTPQPRIGQNYVGFRNRLAILSEAYSYLDFRRRIEVTEAFVEEICRYTAAHADDICRLTQRADVLAIRRGMIPREDRSGLDHEDRPDAYSTRNPQLSARKLTPPRLGVEFELRPLPSPVAILTGEVTKVKNPRSGHDMTAMLEDKAMPVKMLAYGVFEATRSVTMASAYLFRREEGLRLTLEKLQAHGITVEELTAPFTAEVESFTIQGVKRAERPFQGHHEVKLAGRYRRQSMTFPTGTILVRAAQPLGVLAAYLLEPESDDGLVTWNALDGYLEPGKTYPVFKLMHAVNVAGRRVSP